jgi:hypothetical protein
VFNSCCETDSGQIYIFNIAPEISGLAVILWAPKNRMVAVSSIQLSREIN